MVSAAAVKWKMRRRSTGKGSNSSRFSIPVLMVILALAMLVGIGRGLIAWLEHRQRVYLSRGPMPIVRSGLKRPRKS